MKREVKKILFYTHSPRIFRTTLVGHLFEIAKACPVVLLSEKLDAVTQAALDNKELFPKLEKIIPVKQLTENNDGLFKKNRYLHDLARQVIDEYCPDVVITASDMHSLFEMYLFRFARKINALNIAVQPSNTADSVLAAQWIDMINAYEKLPGWLPLTMRTLFIKVRKYIGHFLYHWVLPLSVGERPLWGKSSYILRKGNSGMRDADYQIVFSEKDHDYYSGDGVPEKKIKILAHPLSRPEARDFFEKVYFSEFKNQKKGKPVIAMFLPGVRTGFKRNDNWKPIPYAEREEKWLETVGLVGRILPDWRIIIKPHPDVKDAAELGKRLQSISGDVLVTDPADSADRYVELADVILGLPLSSSTVLFTASMQCPEKPIISLDFHKEVLGDVYANFDGVEYVDTEEKLADILKSIKEGRYRKGNKPQNISLVDTVELIKNLFTLKNENN